MSVENTHGEDTTVGDAIEAFRTLAEKNRENAEDGTAESPTYARGMACAYEDVANYLEQEVDG